MKLHLNRLCRVIVSLAMIFCLLFALCVPSHAVVGVDDAIIAGLLAVLGSMGMDFFAQGLDRSGVVDEVVKWAEDNIGSLPDRVELALVAPNVLSVGGVLWNYAVQCADWFKDNFGSSGSLSIVAPSSKLTFVSAGSSFEGYTFPVDTYCAYLYTNPQATLNSSSGNYWYTFSYWPVAYAVEPGRPSGWGSADRVSFDGQYYYFKLLGSHGFGDSDFVLWQSFMDKSFFLDDYSTDRTTAIKLIFDSVLSGAIVSSGGSLDLVGTDVASPETVPDNKNMFLGLPSSFGSLPEFVNRVFDGVDSDSEAGPLQSDYSSQLSDLIDVNGGILSNTSSIALSASGILSGVQALVADLVGFIGELPGYIGILSGKFLSLWHYVVDWVNSLRPFLNSMFSIWQGLPLAMVLPVYATAVIVIVLGLYKRFFM